MIALSPLCSVRGQKSLEKCFLVDTCSFSSAVLQIPHACLLVVLFSFSKKHLSVIVKIEMMQEVHQCLWQVREVCLQ